MFSEASQIIRIDPPAEEARRLWALALELAVAFGAEQDWSLIGGLMVQLHGFEHEDELRPTVDIDILGGARRPPSMTEKMAAVLVGRGAEVAMPPRSNPKVGYRFVLEGETVEILGPDGLRANPKTIDNLTTLQVSGGNQALRRTEVVLASLGDSSPTAVRRPNLLGAILIKARVVAQKRKDKFASDRQDLIRLLSYVEDPRRLAQEEQLKSSERKWLGKVEELLDFEDPALTELFPPNVIERAKQAFLLLIAPSS